MSLIDNIRDVHSTSLFGSDKIVKVFEDSYNNNNSTVVAGYLRRHSFTHGFSNPLFTRAIIDLANIGEWEDASGSRYMTYSDSSQIHILTYEDQLFTNIQFKVVAFWPHGNIFGEEEALVLPTENSDSDIYYDSQANQQKIHIDKVLGHSSGSVSSTIEHDLGYKPNVRIFFEAFSGQMWPLNHGGSANPWLYDFSNQAECWVAINNNDVVVSSTVPSGTRRIWVRIYYDD